MLLKEMENIPVNVNPADFFDVTLFFEISPDLFCIAGYDGYFKRVNPSVSKLLGYTNDELMARPIDEFVHPDDRKITAKYRDNLRNDVPLLNYENRYITKSGEIVWLAWTSMPLFADKIVYAIAKNITHKKVLEQSRNSLIANLTNINRDLRQLSYTTSHDLRSPVSNLLSIFSMLDVAKIEDEETLQFICILKSATEKLRDTLNNYVDVLIQEDYLQVQVTEINFNESLDTVLQSLNSLIQESNTIIQADFSQAGEISFHQPYIESIFLNLITNSIKYARPEFTPVISIWSEKVGGVTRLIFKDEGMGFDLEKNKDKMFGFQQTFHKHADSKGIGLYLVHSQIASLGGSISVESKLNEGTTFTITFKE